MCNSLTCAFLPVRSVKTPLDLSVFFWFASDMTSEWAVVGPHVRARRKTLGLTQEEIKQHGGPSAALVRQVENGTYDAEMNPAIESSYERALQWKVGSFEAIKRGDGPYPEEASLTATEAAQRLEDVQAFNRRAAKPDQIFIQWFTVRGDKRRLEIEYANSRGLDVEDARAYLEEIAASIEADVTPEGLIAYGTQEDYSLAADRSEKEPFDENQ